MKINNKGFTLVELIVVIAVLGILVLLAMPMFGGYTKDANFAKGIANAKMIEDASELYYMDHEDWPRLTDEHYTQEQMNEYAERFYDNTGKEIELDPNGKYYDIDYNGLNKYVKVNDDKRNYILQNPVGKIYYMEDVSDRGLNRVDYEKDNPKGEDESQNEDDNEEVVFSGLTPEAYDGDLDTHSNKTGDLTWTGNLDDRELTITTYSNTRNSSQRYGIYMTFYDKDGNELIPIGLDEATIYHKYRSTITSKVIVPRGAVKLNFRASLHDLPDVRIKEIALPESMERPSDVEIVNVNTNHHGAYMEWGNSEDNDRYAIYRDNVFLEYVNEPKFDDISLYSDHEYSYKIIPVNKYGNAGPVKKVDIKTDRSEIVFRGLAPEAFDNNLSTYADKLGTVTWEGDLDNKKISISTYSNTGNSSSNYGIYIAFYNENGNELFPIENNNKRLHHKYLSRRTSIVTVPEGTNSIQFTSRLGREPVRRVYDVSVVE